MLGQLRDVLHTVLTEQSSIIVKLNAVTSQNEDLTAKFTSLEAKSRVSSDTSDHHHQKSLKGKFTISPFDSNSLLKAEDLESSGKRLTYYICELIHSKYGIDVEEYEISSCHFLKKGLSFRLINLSPTSTYGYLVKAIKTNQGSRERSFFFNFALTPKRATLLYELRLAKRAKKIERLYSDSDGSISFVSPSAPINSRGQKDKTRISSIFDRLEGEMFIRTYTILELRKELDSIQAVDTLLNIST